MEVVTMRPSHHSQIDPSYLGQAPNMYLTGLGGQQRQQQQHHDSSRGHTPAGQPPNEYSDEMMESPDLGDVTWEDLASAHHASAQWEGHQGPMLSLQMRNLQYPQTAAGVGFPQPEPGLLSASSVVSGTSPMEHSLSASASPAPEVISDFTSPLTPSSFDPEIQTQAMQARQSLSQAQHRHMKSTPSPSRSHASPELSRRRSAPSGSKSATSAGKISKSPKTSQSNSASGARSAHSAIERRYRENINNKIGELHKVLCAAGPPIFPDQEMETGGYPYSRLPRADDDNCSVESGPSAGQAVLPAKKADVLSGAIAYVKRSEKEKELLVEQIRSVTAQLQHFEALVHARNSSLG